MKPVEKQRQDGIPSEAAERERLLQRVGEYAAAQKLVPPLSMEELRDHAEKISPDGRFADYLLVLLNNEVWRETIASIPYTRRLLLLPQCLRHRGECPARMDEFGLLCEECGRCCIGELQALAEELGYVVLIAEGSTVVSRLLEGGKVDAVIGVSCLHALEKSFPHMADGAIPGLAIPLTADGCIGTRTDTGWVREAIRLKSARPWPNQLDTGRLHEIVDGWFTATSLPAGPTCTEQIARDWLLQEGKRWRPFLLASTYSALKNGTVDLPAEVRHLALAVECFHKASLIHDDIEDNDDMRYGQPALHRRHGIAVAINAGDLLVGEGYRWIGTVQNRTAELLRIAADNHCTLCLGQGEELLGMAREKNRSTPEVLEIFRRKTAPAFGVALQLGAVAAGADDDLIRTLRLFSESLGIAYQIRDDLDEYHAGEVRDLRASLFLSLARDHGMPPEETGRTGRMELTPQLRNRLTELMVPEKAAQLLEHYKNEAVRALNPLQNALLKGLLRRVTARMLCSE